jgi:hypothetical protein
MSTAKFPQVIHFATKYGSDEYNNTNVDDRNSRPVKSKLSIR